MPTGPTSQGSGARNLRSRFGSRLRSTSMAAHTATNAASVPALASAAMAVSGINPAKIDGCSPNNVVPDLAVLRVNLRPSTLDDQAGAQALIDRSVADIAAEHDVRIGIHGHFARPPKPMTPETEALFKLVRQAGEDLGQQIGWKSTGGVCDGNNIAACGVPVIDTMGVRGGSIHSMEEFLIVDSLSERAALSELTILRLAEGA